MAKAPKIDKADKKKARGLYSARYHVFEKFSEQKTDPDGKPFGEAASWKTLACEAEGTGDKGLAAAAWFEGQCVAKGPMVSECKAGVGRNGG